MRRTERDAERHATVTSSGSLSQGFFACDSDQVQLSVPLPVRRRWRTRVLLEERCRWIWRTSSRRARIPGCELRLS
jgi:hypothetical protein